MKKFIVRVLAVIGALTILGLFAAAGFWFLVALSKPGVPGKTIVEIDLETTFAEDVPADAFAAALMADVPVMRDIIDGLEKAGNDSRVAGIVARLGGSTMGMAQAQEIRDAVIKFKSKNKFAIAFSETFGEVGPGGNSYYLATAFDQVWLQPSGDIGLTGIILESPFISGTLEKIGVKPRMDHRYEYKNAMNLFTEKQYTAAHREATEKLMTSWFGQMVRGIAEGRKLTEEQVKAIVDRGPLLAKEALDAGLVDGLGYRDEVYTQARQKAGSGAKLLYLQKYLERAGRPHERGKVIALIYGVGPVHRGKSGVDPVFGDVSMGSDTVAGAIRSAIDDSDVKAILFRVDSPGGSYVASDAIWQETVRAKKAGKPVIVSMGDVAGSGGYFVAMAADKIVAQPGTITGSIGVVGGKMLTSGLWEKLGLSWDEVHAGANATIWTGTKDYTPAEWSRFQAWLDRVYADFTSKVAEGRNLPRERVHEMAKGRIWSGEDAKERGLVDELGGFATALSLAKQAAGIGESEEIRLKQFPPKKSPFDIFLGEGPDSGEKEAMIQMLRTIQPFARRLRMLDGGARRGVLSMPQIEIGN
jgi:protease-4